MRVKFDISLPSLLLILFIVGSMLISFIWLPAASKNDDRELAVEVQSVPDEENGSPFDLYDPDPVTDPVRIAPAPE